MQTAKNRIIETSRRDFKVNKLLFVITNLVLFMNFIMQMSIRKFITHYIESETNYYEGYGHCICRYCGDSVVRSVHSFHPFP